MQLKRYSKNDVRKHNINSRGQFLVIQAIHRLPDVLKGIIPVDRLVTDRIRDIRFCEKPYWGETEGRAPIWFSTEPYIPYRVSISATEYFSAKRGDIVLTFICNDCRNRPTTSDISVNISLNLENGQLWEEYDQRELTTEDFLTKIGETYAF
ncbi:hypothetical protein DPMN_093439 [Dreissena polymorpha]|uniref:Uncharacterized protein n=1 Tax=Dreissena polymorpha TaxID=45954 RepID=A0A9D4R1Q6_DREPO|nr:hypothetical protein DPMN_093439 [Dreissena polymorpha]